MSCPPASIPSDAEMAPKIPRLLGGYLWTAAYWTEASVPGGSAGCVLTISFSAPNTVGSTAKLINCWDCSYLAYGSRVLPARIDYSQHSFLALGVFIRSCLSLSHPISTDQIYSCLLLQALVICIQSEKRHAMDCRITIEAEIEPHISVQYILIYTSWQEALEQLLMKQGLI